MDRLRQAVSKSGWEPLPVEKPDLDAAEPFLDSSSDGDEVSREAWRHELAARQPRRRWGYAFWISVLNLSLFGLHVAVAKGYPWYLLDRNFCVKQTSSHSPVFRDMRVEYQTVAFNGSLYPGDDPAWSRKEFGDEAAEAMWESFEDMDTFPITRADVIALGKDPETAVRYTEDFGLGDDAYVATLDVQHKIHCLNELRKMTFADYGATGEEVNRRHVHGQLWWIHLRHCVDMLAQDQICHADADVITYQWMDTQDNAFPDFSLNRKCRKLDDLIAYRNTHRVNGEHYAEMRRPANGPPVVPFEAQYYAMYGFKDSQLFPNGAGYGPLPVDDWFGVPPHDGIPAEDKAAEHTG